MNVENLNKKWNELSVPLSGYVSIRIDAGCIPDLYIGINDESNRCLILEVPCTLEINFKQLNRENLRAFYHKKNNCIILELLDDFYHELFNELIISLYNVLKDIDDAQKSTESFILMINKWSAFLSSRKGEELSKSELRGIIGELVCLEYQINQAESQYINTVLAGWRGLYDETYDFDYEEKAIEVKSKTYNSFEVRISNEFQLDPIPNKGLELFVVSLIPDSNGVSIDKIIDVVRECILVKGGDITLFYSALSAKNLTPSNFKLYDAFKFKIPELCIYDASQSSFPALRKSDLGIKFRQLRYNLNLEECKRYLMHSENPNWS